MTLTTLDPPVQALVSLWTQQYYGDQVLMALELLGHRPSTSPPTWSPSRSRCRRPPSTLGERHTGAGQHRAAAPARRPGRADLAVPLARDHTPVAIETQSTFGYTQNWVVRPLTEDAPA